MGFLDFIFGKPITLDHAFFGTMLFLEDKKESHKSYYECRRHFAPSGKIIEIGIDGDVSGPTQKQIDFFKNIENNYSRIVASIIPIIEDEFRNWKEDFKIDNFQKEFEPEYLGIPRCEDNSVNWEIAFNSCHDEDHIFTLKMTDFEAIEIHIDG